MPLVNVYGASRYEEVMKNTWGHLAPTPRQTYTGYIIFSVSPNGDHNLLDFDFNGLDGNPWTLEHVSEWWSEETEGPEFKSSGTLAIWRWDGTYMVQKNEVPRFRGRSRRMSLVPAPADEVKP
jgi:hypothetical protein